MSYYESIFEEAIDNYGVITAEQAERIGVPHKELYKLGQRNRIERVWQGVYKLTHYLPTQLDQYALALAIVGHDAYLFGESVLVMHNLALVNPQFIYVATCERNRRKLPPGIKLVKRKGQDAITSYEGIRSQKIPDAILACRRSVMRGRLIDAVNDARERGLITSSEAAFTLEELKE
jgi:predicted transcriptional regulator of viral defense system